MSKDSRQENEQRHVPKMNPADHPIRPCRVFEQAMSNDTYQDVSHYNAMIPIPFATSIARMRRVALLS